MRRLVGPAVTVLCLALATALLLNQPLRDRQHDRVVEGRVGEPVTGRDLRLEVHGVRVARTALVRDEPVTSPGAFVIVDVTAEEVGEPFAGLPKLVTADRERSFETSDRAKGDVTLATLTAGFPQHAAYVFELPPDDIAGSILRIQDHSTLKLPVYLEIPLDLDQDEVTDQLARSEPVELATRVDTAEFEREYP